MSLLDMDDFAGAIAETARVLRPGGVFCFAIVHPFDSACDSGAASAAFAVSQPYLTPRRYEDRFDRDGLSITLASMHRPLSAYTTALFRAGLVITGLRERGDREIPWLLVIRAEKRWSGPATTAARSGRHHRAAEDEFPGGIPGGLPARRAALPAPPSPVTWDSGGPVGMLSRRRPERELAEAVQSLGVAGQVAGVTEQGQDLLVAGSSRRVVPGLCCTTRGRLA